MILFVMSMVLGSGIVYAFLESTIEGKIVLLTLFVGSIFSWSVMITKIRVLQFAKSQSERFMVLFRRDREPLNIFEAGLEFDGSPLFEIYQAGCEELCFQVLGSIEVDERRGGLLRVGEVDERIVLLVEQDLDTQHVAVHAE